GIHENEDVMNIFNTGCSMLAFIGHGAAGRWTGGPFFTKEDILRLGNLTRLPFVYTVSCYEGVFDEPGANSIGEGLVIAPNGGAVAHFGTGGLMYLSSVVLGRSMLTYLFDEHINTLGALTSLARLHYSRGKQYNLLGDPLAEIPISCLEIDMEPEPASVSPGDTVHITGRTNPEVSGEAILTFYLPDSLPIKKEDVDIIEGEFFCLWEIPNGEGEALVKVYAYGDNNEGVASTRFMVEGIDIRNIFTIPESPTIRDSVWLNAEISYKLPIDSAGLFWSEDTTLPFTYIPMVSESGLYQTVSPIYINSPGKVYYRIYAVSVDGVIRITELNSYTIPTLPDLMPEEFPFLTVRDSVFICQIVKNTGGEHVEEFIASFYTISGIDTVPIGYDTLSLDGETEDTACVYWNLKQGGVIIKLDEENKVEEENEDNNIVDYTEVDVTLFNISPIEGTQGKVGLSGCICEMDSGIVDRSCVLEILKDDSIYSVKIIPEIIKPEKDYSIWLTLPEEEKGVQTEFGLYNLPLDFYRWVRLDAIKDSIFLRTKTGNIGLFSIFPVGDTISPAVNILSEDDITIYNSFPHFNAIAYDSYGIDVIEKGIKVFLDGIELNRENYSFPIESDNIDEVPIIIRPDSLVDGRYILIVQAWDVNGNMGCDSLLFEKATHLKLQKWGVYPNPASTQTKFWFKFTKSPEDVKVEIYTTGGRLIEKLTCIPITQEVTVPWNLRDSSGRKVANGAYFFRLRASCEGENVEFIEKMAVIR
ncbi:hypothetical protein KAX35_00475, partial [candidate division WOR-3 bacterium]|nr:hypothetical protein [candidate division WOR-3 bacterium]